MNLNRLKALILLTPLLLTQLVWGQSLIKDINIGDGNSNPTNFTRLGNKTYFIANDAIHGYELWVTDGTESGTALVKDIDAGDADGCKNTTLSGSYISTLVALNGNIYFFASNGPSGFELLKSDGTETGTVMVKEIMSGPQSSSTQLGIIKLGSTLLFAANNLTNGIELWKSDGTDTGTVLLKDLDPHAGAGGNPNYFFVDSNLTYFSANDGANGYGLWRTDGTADGTVYLKNAAPTPSKFDSIPYAKYKGDIYFAGFTLDNGTELWKTNGTPEGTELVKDIMPGKESSAPCLFTLYKDKLAFIAKTETTGYELWQTDGTGAGTTLVKDINSGTPGSNPQYLTVLHDTLFFAATDSADRRTLFMSDLTDSGTHRLDSSAIALTQPANLFKFGNSIYLSAVGLDRGAELWRTNGTIAGTHLVMDICNGECGSWPGRFFISDTLLLFTATDRTHGEELWRLDRPTTVYEEVTEMKLRDVYTDPFRKTLFRFGQTSTGTDISYVRVFDLGGNEVLRQDINKPIPATVESFDPGIYIMRAYDKYDRVVGFTRFVKK